MSKLSKQIQHLNRIGMQPVDTKIIKLKDENQLSLSSLDFRGATMSSTDLWSTSARISCVGKLDAFHAQKRRITIEKNLKVM